MHHKSLNTRTLLLAVSLGISALAAPVTAQEFRLQGFLEGDYPGPGGPPCTLDVQELSNSPVSSSNSCSGPNFYSSGVIHMLASRGVISADLELTRCCGGYAKYETDKNISAPSVYFPGPSDLVFTGPQGATHVEISYSMDYSFETDSAIDFENMGGITGNVGGAIINWQLSRPSTSYGVYMSNPDACNRAPSWCR